MKDNLTTNVSDEPQSPAFLVVAVIFSFFFFFFLCEGCIITPFTKNNIFEYQAVMKYFKNSCKSIVGILNT